MNNPQDLIAGKLRLPSPPAIAIRILEMVRNDDFSINDLARVIESDPALVARILKMANSPYYNRVRKIANIEMALTVLGTHAVKNIALSFVICTNMKVDGSKGFDVDLYWRRAITAAVAADLVAEFLGMRKPDIFVTALLQDIGIVVFNLCCQKEYRLVMNEKLTSSLHLHEVEQNCFGFDHQALGAELLKNWQLPEEVYLPIQHHHRNDQDFDRQDFDRFRIETEIVQLSDCLSSIYHGRQSAEKIRLLKNKFDTWYGIQGDSVDRLIDDVACKSLEVFSSFDICPGDMRPFSLILQEANEELTNLNSSYELLVIELKQAKEKAEKLASELHDVNANLQEIAFRDALTGLYNHRYFQESLEKELNRTNRYQSEFSLFIFDIDHFKKINDTYGHPAGDRVLAAIARGGEQCLRNTDIMARYGGEEFVVIMPETNLDGANIVAERLRRAIECLEITVDGVEIKATVSVGVTYYRHGARMQGKEAILSMADKGLYIAKQSGRNRVHAMRIAGT